MSWKDSEKWQAMKEGRDCPFCLDIHLEENLHSFKVAELKSSFVRLPKNQFWKGWTIVALKRHANELFELSNDELVEFWMEVSTVAKAVNEVFKPVKINYAIYGNVCPHLHCHILPQRFEDDPRAPIKQNEKEVFLSNSEYTQMIHDLQRAMQ